MPDFSELLKASSEQVRKDRAIREQHVEELRTANLIAVWSGLAGMSSGSADFQRGILQAEIWKRLGL